MGTPLPTLRLVTPLELVGEGMRAQREAGGRTGKEEEEEDCLNSASARRSSPSPQPPNAEDRERDREGGEAPGGHPSEKKRSDHGHIHSVPAQHRVPPPRTSAPVRRPAEPADSPPDDCRR